MKREIVLDTETTGMDPSEGDRIIEIGCVELINHLPTGKTWHEYINPERDVPAEAVAVHGLTEEFLKDKPLFGEITGSFLDFIEGATLVIHNAEFDMKFLNAELRAFGFPSISMKDVIDTLAMARQKFPGSPANLDALCRRFSIDNSNRTLHGALLDSELLAEVYLELLGGRQRGLSLAETEASQKTLSEAQSTTVKRNYRKPRIYKVPQEELEAHQKLLEALNDPLWKKTGQN